MSEPIRHKPFGGVGPDDIAIINCAFCGDMTSSVPICDTCWTYQDNQAGIDELMIAMPDNWPSRSNFQWRIDMARNRMNTPQDCVKHRMSSQG